jgi:hypothetical protein
MVSYAWHDPICLRGNLSRGKPQIFFNGPVATQIRDLVSSSIIHVIGDRNVSKQANREAGSSLRSILSHGTKQD